MTNSEDQALLSQCEGEKKTHIDLSEPIIKIIMNQRLTIAPELLI